MKGIGAYYYIGDDYNHKPRTEKTYLSGLTYIHDNLMNENNIDSIVLRLSPSLFSVIVGAKEGTIEFGEYPQEKVDGKTSAKLEFIYKTLTSVSPEKIVPLGEEYTIISSKVKKKLALSSIKDYYNRSVLNHKNSYKVYEYNGKKYIRYKRNKQIIWLKVEPIRWRIVKDGSRLLLRTEKSIMNGVPENYLHDCSTWARGLGYLSMIRISEEKTNEFLSNYFLREILQTVKLEKTIKYKNFEELKEYIKKNDFLEEYRDLVEVEFEGPRLTDNEREIIKGLVGKKLKYKYGFLTQKDSKISSKFKDTRKDAVEVKEEVDKNKEEIDKKYQEIIHKIKDLQHALASFEQDKESYDRLMKAFASSIRISEEMLITKVKDHYEFNPEFIDLLKFIDLSMLPTKNLKLSGLDLSETNIHFDPQEIYKKDLSYSKIADHNVSWCSFKGVNLTGANIEDEKESYDYEESIISVDTKLPRNKARAI